MDWFLYITVLAQILIGLLVLVIPVTIFVAMIAAGLDSVLSRAEKARLEKLQRRKTAQEPQFYTSFSGQRDE